MKTGINKFENQGEIWYKMLQNCQMTDFGENNCPTLGLINYMGRDKPFFSPERRGQ